MIYVLSRYLVKVYINIVLYVIFNFIYISYLIRSLFMVFIIFNLRV